MTYKALSIILFIVCFSVYGQQSANEFERYPVFPECKNETINNLKLCFESTLNGFIVDNFKTPQRVFDESYNGQLVVFFEVDREGKFKILAMDAVFQELKDEIERVFDELPQIQPATYNARPTFAQFTLPLMIPLEKSPDLSTREEKEIPSLAKDYSNEYDEIQNLGFTNEKYTSSINIPLSHQDYARFDYYLNQVGNNAHTAQKPYLFHEVNKYYDLNARDSVLYKNKTSWFGRKWWNENMIRFKGNGYWFTLDFGVDLQLGKENNSDFDYTYNNTRMAVVQGGLGKNLSFHSVIYESQGRFVNYFNRYAESIAADGGGNPAIIPGFGIAKEFRGTAYDYPLATGYLSYSPGEMFNFQFGHGKNFLGDGYRSLFLSDAGSPSPYFKINTTFWKLKYTNTWMSMRDVRQEATIDGAFTTKYMATHYLSYNITKRWNIGLFESVLWDNSNDRGFDLNYLNPIIFYRAIEFSTGPRSGNALIGLSSKYKFSDNFLMYGQWIIDEFSTSDVFGGEKSWKNKLGYQIGVKYFRPFNIDNLYLQFEYNQVRPYTYSHNTVVLNYGHNNQSMAHLWGSNFREFIVIARYEKNRLYGSAKVVFGEKGFDFNTEEDSFNYGGDIYRDERDRNGDTGIELAQGNTTSIFHGELQIGYLLNPSTNFKVYANLIYRDFNPLVNTATEFNNTSTWFNFGIRTDIFNWYYDF